MSPLSSLQATGERKAEKLRGVQQTLAETIPSPRNAYEKPRGIDPSSLTTVDEAYDAVNRKGKFMDSSSKHRQVARAWKVKADEALRVRRMTRKELSVVTGYSPGMISKALNVEEKIGADATVVRRIADVLELPVELEPVVADPITPPGSPRLLKLMASLEKLEELDRDAFELFLRTMQKYIDRVMSGEET